VLDPKGWLCAAQSLPEGARRRVDHDCGGGRTLVVSHKPDGWHAFCFRCDDYGWVAKPAPSLAERLARRRAQAQQDASIQASLALPAPVNTDVDTWPLPARVWLYRAGIGKPEIAQLGAYWHETSGRVVLPVVQGDAAVYWQARDPCWTRQAPRPKYINPPVDKSTLVARYGSGAEIVLVEDILSAFRVGQVAECWSLLGTNLTDAVLAQILASRKSVAVWLDPDAAGRAAARRIQRQLLACGVPARRIQTDRDPKLLSKQEVQTVLGLNFAAAAAHP